MPAAPTAATRTCCTRRPPTTTARDAFNFTATGPDGPDTAAVTITINAVNDAPACSGDASTGDEDTVQAGTVACTDIDNGALTYSKVAGPAHGSATVNTNGSWTYTPAANYNGADSFTFRANDGALNSSTVTMSLTIPAVNDAPVCGDKTSAGDKNQQQTGTIACTDVDDASLTISQGLGSGPRLGQRRHRRRLDVHAHQQLQRVGHVHVPRQRRLGQLEHRQHGAHDQRHERGAALLPRRQLRRRGRGPDRNRDLHRRR